MSRLETVSIRIALILAFVTMGWSLYNKPAPTPEQVQAKEDARLQKETDMYVRAESDCMSERPYSEARADCIWEAQRDYPQGYLLSLKNSLGAARAQYYKGNTN